MTEQNKNLELWNKVEEVPVEFTKEIKGGRLKGKTDISPLWRIWQLTEHYGPCGTGWYYKLIDWKVVQSNIPGKETEASVQAHIELFVGDSDKPITGVGGSKILAQEAAGMHHNDEALKMAVTDAIGVACKCLGFASAIYEGRFDGSKYTPRAEGKKEEYISEEKAAEIALKFNAIGISQSLLEAKSGFPMSKWVQADVDSAIKLYKTEKKKVDAANKG